MGDAGLVVSVASSGEARGLAASVEAAGLGGVVGAVVGIRSVLVHLDPGVADVDELGRWLATAPAAPPSALPARTVEVPVVFGGPDTDEVCRRTSLGPDALAEVLSASLLTVAAVGFSPGFAYLDGLPEVLRDVPRHPRPRTMVPAGSVALGGGLAAVYPQATPGGWSLVGWTPLRLFDPSVPPYALLRPGDAVRFVVASEVTHDGGGSEPGWPPVRGAPGHGSHRRSAPRPPWSAGDGAAAVVEEPGLLSIVQDAGRLQWAHLGVPAGGPADPLAHGVANRLVGNLSGAPAIEVTGTGPVLRALRPLHVAAFGGEPAVSVDGKDVGCAHVVPVAAGQRVAIGATRTGLRSYLAVAGGVLVPEVLGSRSTDGLSWVGPGPLVRGDELRCGDPEGPMGDHVAVTSAVRNMATAGGSGFAHRTLRILAGPHQEWFAADMLAKMASRRYVVQPESDRVGLRLAADDGTAVERRLGELTSLGMVTGAVQVPPDGAPVVLGPDHATLGGYPVAAVVINADHWVLGQCRPGDTLSLEPVDAREAAAALAEVRRWAAEAVAGTYPVVPA